MKMFSGIWCFSMISSVFIFKIHEKKIGIILKHASHTRHQPFGLASFLNALDAFVNSWLGLCPRDRSRSDRSCGQTHEPPDEGQVVLADCVFEEKHERS